MTFHRADHSGQLNLRSEESAAILLNDRDLYHHALGGRKCPDVRNPGDDSAAKTSTSRRTPTNETGEVIALMQYEVCPRATRTLALLVTTAEEHFDSTLYLKDMMRRVTSCRTVPPTLTIEGTSTDATPTIQQLTRDLTSTQAPSSRT